MKTPIIWLGNIAKSLTGIFQFNSGTQIIENAGDPSGAVTAPKGSIVLDRTNGQVHVNTDGSTAYRNLVTYVTYATVAEAEAATPVGVAVAFIEENYGLYAYCDSCNYPADHDLVLSTGNGGNTRWEMIQKMSRTQGDTGWINTDTAVISKLSSTQARLNISSTAAIAIKGVRIPVPVGNYDITISGAAGPKFIGFDDDTLVLKSRNTVWDFAAECPVMVVYWDGAAIVAAPQTEFHGIRDAIWHIWAHRFLGTQYVSGLSFTGSVQTDNNTNPGADDSVFYLWSTSGVIQDEDYQSSPGTGQWLQTLGSGLTSSTAGIFNHFYFNGTAIVSVDAMADRAPFIHAGANTPPQWNNGGTLTASITGDYIVYHYFATPMTGGWAVFSRPHNAKYTSLATALGASPTQLTWTNYAELKHLYTAVFRVNTGWSNTHQCKLVSLRDFRTVAGTPVAATNPTAHSSLSGLELAGTGVTWGHVNDTTQTIAGAKTFSSLLTPSAGIVGRTTTPAAGEIGEVIRNSPIDSRTSLPASEGTKTVCSVPLTPGSWLVSASFAVDPGGITLTRAQGQLTTGTSISVAIFDPGYSEACQTLSQGYAIGVIHPTEFNVSVNTTVNLIVKPTYSGTPSSTALSGKIIAERRA